MVRNSSLRFDAVTPATTASCFSLSTVLTSRISGSKWRERTCSLFCICAVHSFTLIVVSPRFRLCSFFYLFSHLASLISSYHDVQYDDGAHKAERSSNAASELRALRQAIQGMTTKLLRFPKLRTVWFSRVVVLRLVPVLAGKAPVKAGCSGVGALARFQIFPWIHLDTTHARPNGVMLASAPIAYDGTVYARIDAARWSRDCT